MSSSKLFPGIGKAVGRSESNAEAEAAHSSSSSRSSSTGRGGSGGGSSSRDNTPIIARYAILSAAAGAVAAGTVVEGRGVTSSVAVGSSALLLDGGGVGGEPRTSTPARLSRVLTPLKGQGRRLTHALAGTITTLADLQAREEQERQQEEAAAARRIERRSRRKMRRWANDRLLGVAQVYSLHGGGLGGDDEGTAAVAEGEYGPFLDGSHPSKFSTLMAAENTELRDRFLAGYGGKRAAGGAGRGGGEDGAVVVAGRGGAVFAVGAAVAGAVDAVGGDGCSHGVIFGGCRDAVA